MSFDMWSTDCIRCDEERIEAQDAAGDFVGSMCSRMIVCTECGNKRCPKATWHENDCTGSNDPGQHGSDYAKFTVSTRTFAEIRAEFMDES